MGDWGWEKWVLYGLVLYGVLWMYRMRGHKIRQAKLERWQKTRRRKFRYEDEEDFEEPTHDFKG